MKIISVVGARPNFMKIAPFIRAIEENNRIKPADQVEHILVHTGQHYDDRMSKSFFESLKIPAADINLSVGSGTHAEQVGQTMIEFEKVLRKEKPDWVVVVGDVNATLACSVTAKKENIRCCHIEAGLRSGDLRMPEEINRIVTDRLSDLLLVTDRIAGRNLISEGVPMRNIKFVGNIMIDTLEANHKKAELLQISEIISSNLIIEKPGTRYPAPGTNFAVITLHRPSNVDKQKVLEPIVNFLSDEVTEDMPLIWTIHPRTQKQLKEFGLWEKISNNNNIYLLHPVGYHEMLKLNMEARVIFTDSGGLQGESTILGTPCLTLRWNTEQPVTLKENGGTCVIAGTNIESIRKEYHKTIQSGRKPYMPELWDGKTAGRCLSAIQNCNS